MQKKTGKVGEKSSVGLFLNTREVANVQANTGITDSFDGSMGIQCIRDAGLSRPYHEMHELIYIHRFFIYQLTYMRVFGLGFFFYQRPIKPNVWHLGR